MVSAFAAQCLRGECIVITGALGAIGQVIVSTLLDHGANVVAADLLGEDEAERIAAARLWPQERCRYVRADASRPGDAQRVIESAAARFGRVDIALCHAGIVREGPILECSEQQWDQVLDANLKGAFLVAQCAARDMLRRGVKGKIVFTSSWVQDVPWPGITAYTVSKSGMRTLMRGMARELAEHGIRVNAIAPGIVGAGMAQRQYDSDPEYRRRASRAIPLGELQTPESVAAAVLFLCSNASDYMTGATLLVDGGASLYPMD